MPIEPGQYRITITEDGDGPVSDADVRAAMQADVDDVRVLARAQSTDPAASRTLRGEGVAGDVVEAGVGELAARATVAARDALSSLRGGDHTDGAIAAGDSASGLRDEVLGIRDALNGGSVQTEVLFGPAAPVSGNDKLGPSGYITYFDVPLQAGDDVVLRGFWREPGNIGLIQYRPDGAGRAVLTDFNELPIDIGAENTPFPADWDLQDGDRYAIWHEQGAAGFVRGAEPAAPIRFFRNAAQPGPSFVVADAPLLTSGEAQVTLVVTRTTSADLPGQVQDLGRRVDVLEVGGSSSGPSVILQGGTTDPAALSAVRADAVDARPGAFAPPSLLALYPEHLVASWDYASPMLYQGAIRSKAGGTQLVDTVLGDGPFGRFAAVAAAREVEVDTSNQAQLIALGNGATVAKPAPGAGAAWVAGGDCMTLWAGRPRDLNGEGQNNFWQIRDGGTGSVLARLDTNRDGTRFRVRLVVAGVVVATWDADYDATTTGPGSVAVRLDRGGEFRRVPRVAFGLAAGVPRLWINEAPATVTQAATGPVVLPVGTFQFGPLVGTLDGLGTVSAAALSTFSEGAPAEFAARLDRPVKASDAVIIRPEHIGSSQAQDIPRPGSQANEARGVSLIGGPHDPRSVHPPGDKRRTQFEGRVALGIAIPGNIQALVYPAGADAPWSTYTPNGTRPFPDQLDQTVLRPSMLRDPMAPDDPTRFVGIFDGYMGRHRMLAYRSADSGQTFQREPVLTPDTGWAPGPVPGWEPGPGETEADHPMQTEADRPRVAAIAMPGDAAPGQVNNIMWADGSFGLALDLQVTHPGGYSLPGKTQKYAAAMLMEYTGGTQGSTLWGAKVMPAAEKWREIVDPTTWERIAVLEHPWPHTFTEGLGGFLSYGPDQAERPGRPAKTNIEDHWLGYDAVADEFYVGTRDRTVGYAVNGFAADLAPRQFYIARSRKGDLSRFPQAKRKPLFRSPSAAEQFYDYRVVQVREDLWYFFVTAYTDYDTGGTAAAPNPAPAGAPQGDRNLWMRTDLYVSRDQGRSTQMVRRDMALPQAGTWTEGIAMLYPHAVPGKAFLLGSRGQHPEGSYGGDLTGLAVIDLPLPAEPVADRVPMDGSVVSDEFDCAKVGQWLVDRSGGAVVIRVTDTDLKAIPGYENGEVRADGFARWSGSTDLPASGAARLVVEGRTNLSTISPVVR